jgi:ElaB/YqjD/DUF883 family membrane-anchored ribosome-binding protein
MAYGNGLFSASHADEARRAARNAYGKTKEAAHLASHSAKEAGAAFAEGVKHRAADAKHRAADLGHDVSERATEQASEARDYILSLLGALTTQADGVVKSAKSRLKDIHAEDYAKTAAAYSGQAVGLVKRHPLLAIGGAVALGFIIGKTIEAAAAARREKLAAEEAEGSFTDETDTSEKD